MNGTHRRMDVAQARVWATSIGAWLLMLAIAAALLSAAGLLFYVYVVVLDAAEQVAVPLCAGAAVVLGFQAARLPPQMGVLLRPWLPLAWSLASVTVVILAEVHAIPDTPVHAAAVFLPILIAFVLAGMLAGMFVAIMRTDAGSGTSSSHADAASVL